MRGLDLAVISYACRWAQANAINGERRENFWPCFVVVDPVVIARPHRPFA